MIRIEIKNVTKAVPEFRITNRKPEYDELNKILNESPAVKCVVNLSQKCMCLGLICGG